MRVEIKTPELSVDKPKEIIAHYAEFNMDYFIYHLEGFMDKHPDGTDDQVVVDEDVFHFYYHVYLRSALAGIEVFRSLKDGIWVCALEFNGVADEMRIKFAKEKEARAFGKISADWMLNKFVE